jgi:rare lipoprotein A
MNWSFLRRFDGPCRAALVASLWTAGWAPAVAATADSPDGGAATATPAAPSTAPGEAFVPLPANEPLLVDVVLPQLPAARSLLPAPAAATSEPGAEAVEPVDRASAGDAAEPAPPDGANPNATVVWGESPDAAHAAAAAVAVQIGEASWYGVDFHGRSTASGETYDMHAMTVAHRSWPLGAVVRIQNLENGRTTLARVNDRGPFARGRILDCSYAIAKDLGFITAGAADVQITLLDVGQDAWVRYDPALAPREIRRFGPPAPVEVAIALTSVEDAAPRLPPAPAAHEVGRTAGATVAMQPAFRTASVLPFPAIAHAWWGVYRWIAGTEARPGRWPAIERRLQACGMRQVLRWIARA